MKPSGIDWLGDIPAHWEVGNIRRYADMRTGHTPSRQNPEYWTDCAIPWFTLADVWQLRSGVRVYLGGTAERISEIGLANSAAELLPAGTVILSRTASVGYTGIMPKTMATSQDFWNWVCGPRLHPEYLLWQLRAMVHVFSTLTSGSTHKTIYRGDAASLRLVLPPRDEQAVIANFLNERTARIDGLIARKKRLLELLAEKRQVLITHAVTKGLDPNAPMKPSGIGCLGDIPAHWEVVPFKWCCFVKSGQVDPTEPQFAQMTLIAPDHIEATTGQLLEAVTAEEQGAISGKYFCPPDSILYSKIRPALRKVALYEQPCLCSADMYAIIAGPKIHREYLYLYLLSEGYSSYAEMSSMRVAMPKVNREALGDALVPHPPRDEQMAIAESVGEQIRRIGKATSQIGASVARLHDYRSALITAAVTGQFDLTEDAA